MNTTRHLFLDLEDTLVEPVMNGWPNVNLIPPKLEQVRAFIKSFNPHFVHVFSFAIWNEHEHMRFCTYLQPRLEHILGVKFCTIPTVDDDIIPLACRHLALSPDAVTFADASDFWGKGESFRLYIKQLWHDLPGTDRAVEAILIDDAVTNEMFEFPDLHIKGRLLNVDSELWRTLAAPE